MSTTHTKLPANGRIVICVRRWIPCHVGNDGQFRYETVLASRNTDEPWSVDEDTSKNCWWEGRNEKDGHSWSDSTVESWREIDLDESNITPLRSLKTHLEEVAKETTLWRDPLMGQTHRVSTEKAKWAEACLAKVEA